MKTKLFCLAIASAFSAVAHAGDIDSLQVLSQSEFKTISKDLTAALSYKAVAPAEALGITGFDLGVEVTGTSLESKDIWNKAAGSDLSTLPLAKLHVHKGLPFGIDVGAVYAAVPGSNVQLMGGEIRYAILDGNVALPALAVRGAMTKLSGVDQLDFSSKSLEVSLSKGFLMFTPYAGLGRVWGTSTPHAGSLTEEKVSASKVFVGANVNLGLLNLAGEFDKTGSNNSYSVKAGFRF